MIGLENHYEDLTVKLEAKKFGEWLRKNVGDRGYLKVIILDDNTIGFHCKESNMIYIFNENE